MQIFTTQVQRPRVYTIYAPPSDRKRKPAASCGVQTSKAKVRKGDSFLLFVQIVLMASSVTIFQPRVHSAGVDFQRPRYERPSSAQLSGMKFELYNPRLPTLRRMDMDSVSHKLSSEHSRTTTPCTRGSYSIRLSYS